jgi:hypothetical protein
MIKIEELRIGNLVSSIGIIYKVTLIDIHGNIRGVEGSTSFNLDKTTNPIPLTEEWLLKFGFQQTDPKKFIGGLYTRKKTDGFYGFYINKETMSYCTFDYEGTIEDIIKIEYVHQLQNLYFALTGEELNYKPL